MKPIGKSMNVDDRQTDKLNGINEGKERTYIYLIVHGHK